MKLRILGVLAGLTLTGAVLSPGQAAAAPTSRIRGVRPTGSSWPAHLLAPEILYAQMDNWIGVSILSENLPPPREWNTSGADDFVVPAGETWVIQGVQVASPSNSTVRSERVRFFEDSEGLPGALIAAFENRRGHVHRSSLTVWLGSEGLVLSSGTYWLAFQSNSTTPFSWAWGMRAVISNAPAVWQNPHDEFGTGCTTWTPLGSCSSYEADLMFALAGVKM
jgi:hypothetical protein